VAKQPSKKEKIETGLPNVVAMASGVLQNAVAPDIQERVPMGLREIDLTPEEAQELRSRLDNPTATPVRAPRPARRGIRRARSLA
jgi:hypothetical protein